MAKDETHFVNDRAVKRFSVSYSGAWIHSSFLGARVKFAVASMHNAFELALNCDCKLLVIGYYLAL